MNIKSGNIDGFKQYSQFSSLKEFNTHMEMWLLEHKHEFSKAELVGLKRLVRFSAKIPGVCNAKIGTVLKAIHEEYNDNGISRSTFKRMILKAKKLGILQVHETERKNGSQSSNLYIFNRFPTTNNEPPKQEKLDHHNETSNPIKTNQNNINKRMNDDQPRQRLDYTFTNEQVPTSFVQWVKIYFNDAKIIEEFWRMVKIAAYQNNCENDSEQVLSIAIAAFKQLMRKIKFTKAVKKPIAYFYGIVKKKFKELYFEDLYDMGVSPEFVRTTGLLSLFQQWIDTP
ncbi:hypothetical protein ACNQFZ_12970 [Schinkia sp. CFF1]